MTDPKHAPNYLPAVLKLAASNPPPPGVTFVEINHDDHCSIWADGPCDCEPVVSYASPPDRRAQR